MKQILFNLYKVGSVSTMVVKFGSLKVEASWFNPMSLWAVEY